MNQRLRGSAMLGFIVMASSACEKAPSIPQVAQALEANTTTPAHGWRTRESKDEISDVVRHTLWLSSSDSAASLTLSCDHKIVGITFHAPDLWAKYEDAHLGHRFDDKPGIEIEKWNGDRKLADAPYEKAAKYLQEMLISKRWTVRYEALDEFPVVHFDNISDGLAEGLRTLSAECLHANGII